MKKITIICLFLLGQCNLFSQGVKISESGGSPDSSSLLEVESTTKGFLPPRMNTQERDQINDPAEGLQIYNTDVKCMQFFDGTNWSCGGMCVPSPPVSSGHDTNSEDIIWNWSPVAGAEGYSYNTVNDYASSTDISSATTFQQTGLTCGGQSYTLYVWSYNDCGHSLFPATFTGVTESCPCVIGSAGPGGGVVFYCSPTLRLEALTTDQATDRPFGCQGTDISTSTDVGSGQENTFNIVSNCAEPNTSGSICYNLVSGGFTDWYTPSRDELYQMWVQRNVISMTTNVGYISSSQGDSNNAYRMDMGDGSFVAYPKEWTFYRTRCIREF